MWWKIGKSCNQLKVSVHQIAVESVKAISGDLHVRLDLGPRLSHTHPLGAAGAAELWKVWKNKRFMLSACLAPINLMAKGVSGWVAWRYWL